MAGTDGIVDVAIVGSGPAGLSAAAHAAQRGMSHVLLEKTDHLSDTIYKYQKGKHVMATPSHLVLRADLEREGRRYADALGFTVDWEAVARLDDEMLVGGIAQVAPFDPGSKQALLEAADIADRADMLVQFMQFARLMPGGADGPATFQ